MTKRPFKRRCCSSRSSSVSSNGRKKTEKPNAERIFRIGHLVTNAVYSPGGSVMRL